MVEFALILPIMLLLFCGIIELSWLLYGKITLQNAVREAARAGSVGTTITEATTNAQNCINELVPEELNYTLNTEISFSDTANLSAGDITVDISGTTAPLTPLAGIFGFNAIQVAANCTMKMN